METLLSEHSFIGIFAHNKVVLIVIFLQLTTLDMLTPPGCDGLHSIIICTLFCTTFPLLRTQEAGAGQQRNRANFAHISQQVRSAVRGRGLFVMSLSLAVM